MSDREGKVDETPVFFLIEMLGDRRKGKGAISEVVGAEKTPRRRRRRTETC